MFLPDWGHYQVYRDSLHLHNFFQPSDNPILPKCVYHETELMDCIIRYLKNLCKTIHLLFVDEWPYLAQKQNQWQCGGNHIQRVKIVINENIIEQVTYFKYLGYCISEYKSDLEDKLQTYNKINGDILGKKWTRKQN